METLQRILRAARPWRLAGAALFLAHAAGAAFEVPSTSPLAVIRQRIAATEIEVAYHRPSARGREIFGALVPYGQVWRTGADNATRITFSTPVTFGGVAVDAGAYELFTVPGPAEWEVILQAERSRWGSYAYDPQYDLARITAVPRQLADRVETLTLGVDDVRPAAATLSISWDRSRVAVPIEIDVRATVVPLLEEALSSEEKPPYFRAAMFYFDNDLDIDRAAQLIALALEAAPTHIGMLYRQALILERQGNREGAVAAAEASLEGAASAPRELREEYTRLNMALLERLR